MITFRDVTPRYFAFESGFVDSLRCIPMCVRLKLDLAGVKLKLGEWAKMNPAEREYLVEMPCETQDEIRGFRDFISLLVRINCGALPTFMDAPVERTWETEAVPAQVTEKGRLFGIAVLSGDWQRLDTLQRFALVKLSRPGHEGKNFLPALEEFGLTGSRGE